MFALGLVLLELGLLESIQNIYDTEKNKFSEYYLRKYVERFLSKYPDDCLLGQAICFMLETDDDLRPDFITLRQRLPDFEEVDSYFAALQNRNRPAHSIPTRPSILNFNERQSNTGGPLMTASERNSYLKYVYVKKDNQYMDNPFENMDQQQKNGKGMAQQIGTPTNTNTNGRSGNHHRMNSYNAQMSNGRNREMETQNGNDRLGYSQLSGSNE